MTGRVTIAVCEDASSDLARTAVGTLPAAVFAQVKDLAVSACHLPILALLLGTS